MEEHYRNLLVAYLRETGALKSESVEKAMAAVSRYHFVREMVGCIAEAYKDTVVPLRMGLSTVSQPTLVAEMLEALDVRPGANVLEIGTASGYNAALLAELTGDSGKVTTVEIDAGLAEAARTRLESAGFGTRVGVVTADGRFGYGPGSPYNRIVITAGVATLRPELVRQLVPDSGRIVAPIETAGGFSLLFVGERPPRRGGAEAALSGRFQGLPLAFVPLRGSSWDEAADEPWWDRLGAAERDYADLQPRFERLLNQARREDEAAREREAAAPEWAAAAREREVAARLILALVVEAGDGDPLEAFRAIWFDRGRPGLSALRFAFLAPTAAGQARFAVKRGEYLLGFLAE